MGVAGQNRAYKFMIGVNIYKEVLCVTAENDSEETLLRLKYSLKEYV